MKSVIRTITILKDGVGILFNTILIPIPFIINCIWAIPETIIALLCRFRKFSGLILAFGYFLYGMTRAFPRMNVFKAAIWFFSSGQYLSTAGLEFLVATFIFFFGVLFLSKLFYTFFYKVDQFFYAIYTHGYIGILAHASSMKDAFNGIAFGSYRERELFEMDEFRSAYGIF